MVSQELVSLNFNGISEAFVTSWVKSSLSSLLVYGHYWKWNNGYALNEKISLCEKFSFCKKIILLKKKNKKIKKKSFM